MSRIAPDQDTEHVPCLVRRESTDGITADVSSIRPERPVLTDFRESLRGRMQLFRKIWNTGMVTELLQAGDPAAIDIGHALEYRIKRLFGRALAIREVDAGSCNGCELEITGLTSPVYDMERFGMHFVASPSRDF